MSELEQRRWQKLLAWLHEHGMKSNCRVERRPRAGAGFGLFATEFCPPSEQLFAIPSTALINVATLAAHYPSSSSLSPTQLISLHLFISRPMNGHDSDDAVFGPFISILPREFDSHPLTWMVRRKVDNSGSPLLELLPPSITSALTALRKRFFKDWDIISKYNSDQGLSVSGAVMDYLWAWLNVNTRCIYHRLKSKRSDPANVTLCPVLDFANHDWNVSHMIPVSNAEIWSKAPSVKQGDEFSFLGFEKAAIEPGQEIYLTYGSHSNHTLFVEYGFINNISENSIRSGEYPAEVDVQQIMEGMFESQGEIGSWMKEVLEDEGYWGDWTLHSSPFPASPSFRVICALRLYAEFSDAASIPKDGEAVLQAWRNTLMGTSDRISEQNERMWRETLQQICQQLIDGGVVGRAKVANFVVQAGDADWVEWMKSNIAGLWNEQEVVAKSVLESLRDGLEF